MNTWRETTLAAVADEVTVGHVGPMARHYQEDGIPFLRSLNVNAHTINLRDVMFISDSFHAKLKKSALRPGDVVTVRTGKPGVTSVIPEDLPTANCSDLVITRPGPALNARWFSYYMNSVASNFVDSQLVGAVQQHFNVGSAKAMKIRLPSLKEQEAIAEVLGALDDKIAANTKRASTIDQFIATTYRSAIRGPETTERLLFEVFDVDFGEAFKGAFFSEPDIGRPLIRIRDLKTYSSQVWTSESRPREVTVLPGDILVGMDAEFRPTAWLGESGLLNQRVCRMAGKSTGPAFARESLKAPLAEIENYKTGTTVIHLNKGDLEQAKVLMPGERQLRSFEASTEGLYQARIQIATESRQLAITRDALLPQLMSGKLQVKDAESVLEGAI